MAGPTGIFSGNGHAISPAANPDGRAHSMRGGSPESPGFTQYVCQPGVMRWYRATQKVCPGVMAPTSLTSSTCTRGPSGMALEGLGPATTRNAHARTARVPRRLMQADYPTPGEDPTAPRGVLTPNSSYDV